MCLGEIVQLVRIDGESAVVRAAGSERPVSLLTLDEPLAPGDWLVVHSGFALHRITADEATLALAIRRPDLEVTP